MQATLRLESWPTWNVCWPERWEGREREHVGDWQACPPQALPASCSTSTCLTPTAHTRLLQKAPWLTAEVALLLGLDDQPVKAWFQ